MNIYLLKAKQGDSLWRPWYDKCFGFTVVAESEEAARRLASAEAGDEGPHAWLSAMRSTCEQLGETHLNPGVLLRDFAAA